MQELPRRFSRKDVATSNLSQDYKLEKVWDPVTRLWHWVLVVSISVGWSFGRFMSFDTVQWHFYIGYLVLGLMLFRILWGFAGPAPVRLRALLPGPRALFHYLRNVGKRKPSGTAGHNPLGLTWWHHLNADFILILVVLHVAAILFYLLWKRENLVKPMITGWKWVKRDNG